MNGEIPFVVVASAVDYVESLPMSANCVQSVKTSTKFVFILRVVQLSHCRTSELRKTRQAKQKHCLTLEIFAKHNQ